MRKWMRGVAVLERGQVAVVDDIPMPIPGDYEVLVKVRACGICNGTDLGYIDGTVSELEGLRAYPTILGHESAGEVVARGKKVRHIAVGEKMIHTNLRDDLGCGYTKTHGAMAEYGLIPDVQAILEDGYSNDDIPGITGYGPHLFDYRDGPNAIGRLGADMDLVDAGVFQTLCESLAAARNFGVGEGSEVLVYGCGPMGIAFSLFSKLLGAKRVTAVDGIEARLERAAAVGRADRLIDFTAQNTDEALGDARFDIVVDAAGSSSILMEGSHRCRENGTVGAMGVLKRSDTILDVAKFKNAVRLHMLNFPHLHFASLDLLQAMIRRGEVRPKDFYSHVLPMEEVKRGLELVRTREAFKVVLTF